MSTGEHSLLAPSSAHRRIHCPGSVTLTRDMPRDDTPEAAEGDAAHWAAMQYVCGRTVQVGDSALNRVIVTDEMVEGAILYADDIAATVGDAEVHVEERIEGELPDEYGTPDAWSWNARARLLHLWDYKFGHKYVAAYLNWQLIQYAGMLLRELGINGLHDQAVRVVMRVVQPRYYRADGFTREWSVVASELRPYLNQLHAANEESLLPNAPVRVGPGCYKCPARHVCQALQDSATHAADVAHDSTPLNLTSGALARELHTLKRASIHLTQRIEGLTEEALRMAQAGQRLSGFMLEKPVGREQWTLKPDEVVALGKMFGADLAKPSVLTPAQARKAGLPADVVNPLVMRPEGAWRIVEDSGDKAREIFSKGSKP